MFRFNLIVVADGLNYVSQARGGTALGESVKQIRPEKTKKEKVINVD